MTASPENPLTREDVLHCIDAALVRSCVTSLGDGVRAVILTGSVARREASLIQRHERWTMLGDVEGVLVLDDARSLPPAPCISELCKQIQLELAEQGIGTDVSLAVVHDDFLRMQPAHIFAYELRNCGRVLWGEPEILRIIPEFAASDLSREDAWRMLCNRMIELLEFAPGSETRSDYSFAMQYRVAKLYLDMATSLLIFLNAYEPTYRGRAEALTRLSARPDIGAPFCLQEFAECVRACTDYKLCPESRSIPAEFIGKAGAYACRLWNWELQQMTGARASARQLLRKLAGEQTVAQRVRGWMYVVRRQGWLKSWRQWPRWGRIARSYSPRYAVYLAGFKLFSCLSDFAASNQQIWKSHAEIGINGLLPVGLPGSAWGWQQLSRQILENYKLFVRDTRA